jgi:hypothetical protein
MFTSKVFLAILKKGQKHDYDFWPVKINNDYYSENTLGDFSLIS